MIEVVNMDKGKVFVVAIGILVIVLIILDGYAFNVTVLEHYPEDVYPVMVEAIDGSTVLITEGVNKGSIVNMIGYEANSIEAREYLDSLCKGKEAYMLFEDPYSGYLWCGNEKDGYRSVQRSFIVDRPDLVDRLTTTLKEKYPYRVWGKEHEVRGVLMKEVMVKTGVYKVCYKNFFALAFNLEPKCVVEDMLNED